MDKTNLSLIKCEADKVGIGVVNCDEQIIVEHYGDRPQNDGGYSLCDKNGEDLLKRALEIKRRSKMTEIEQIRNQISYPSWVLDKLTIKEVREELQPYLNDLAKTLEQSVVRSRKDELMSLLTDSEGKSLISRIEERIVDLIAQLKALEIKENK